MITFSVFQTVVVTVLSGCNGARLALAVAVAVLTRCNLRAVHKKIKRGGLCCTLTQCLWSTGLLCFEVGNSRWWEGGCLRWPLSQHRTTSIEPPALVFIPYLVGALVRPGIQRRQSVKKDRSYVGVLHNKCKIIQLTLINNNCFYCPFNPYLHLHTHAITSRVPSSLH